MARPVSLEEMQERCAMRLYKSFPGDTPWEDVEFSIQEGIRRMVTFVFKELFETDPTDIAMFFIDGRPL